MPFGGMLTVGLIGAGANVANGAMGSKAAKSAANTMNNAGQAAASNITQTATQANQGIASATSGASGLMGDATRAAQDTVTGAAASAAGGVKDAATAATQGVQAGTTAANDTLRSTLGQQLSNLDPYSKIGSDTAAAYSAAMGPDGALSKQFSWNPNGVQNNLDYQFRMQQGQDEIAKSAAARGLGLSGAQLKAAGRYAAGVATQGLSDDYNRAMSTFQANRNNTLTALGLGLNVGQSATGQANSALAAYGNQAAQNTLGAAQYGGNAGINAAQYAGNAGLQGAQYAGNAGMQGAQYQGNAQMQGALSQASNTMNAASLADQYRLAAAQAVAGGKTSSANSWANALSGTANIAGSLVGLNAANNGAGSYNYGNLYGGNPWLQPGNMSLSSMTPLGSLITPPTFPTAPTVTMIP